MTIARLHHELVAGLLRDSRCPTNAELAAQLSIPPTQVETLLGELSAIHGVVLHPHVCEPWIIHPFSVTPTLNYIRGAKADWWSPCIWCALGVCTLAGGHTEIHTRIGATRETLVIEVEDGEPVSHRGLYVHFAIPPIRAWDNVHQHCSLVLPFHTPEDIDRWTARYGQPRGEAVPITQVAALAKVWYGRHADPDWRKWTMAEAQSIFGGAGLTADFWNLGPPKAGTF